MAFASKTMQPVQYHKCRAAHSSSPFSSCKCCALLSSLRATLRFINAWLSQGPGMRDSRPGPMRRGGPWLHEMSAKVGTCDLAVCPPTLGAGLHVASARPPATQLKLSASLEDAPQARLAHHSLDRSPGMSKNASSQSCSKTDTTQITYQINADTRKAHTEH